MAPSISSYNRPAAILVGLVLSVLQPTVAPALGDEGKQQAPLTNTQILLQLARQLGDSLLQAVPLDTMGGVRLVVQPGHPVWYVEQPLAEALSRAGVRVVTGDAGRYELAVGVSRAQVRYESIRRDGFLGPHVVDRIVELGLNVRAADRDGERAVRTADVSGLFRDTVDVDEIPRLEDPNLPVTRGTVPREGFFSSILEPVVTVSAVAVAVYLLFTVRK